MDWKSDYILVCDEHGTTRWPSSSKSWTSGGYIVKYSSKELVKTTWAKIKATLCLSPDMELKWSHFFVGRHLSGKVNPLKTNDPIDWHNQAIWAIEKLFSECNLTAMNTVVRKDRASEAAFIPSGIDRVTHSYKVLDVKTIWIGILGLFSIFLHQENSVGEVWFDQLGSRSEEVKRNEDWQCLRNEPNFMDHENQVLLLRISPQISFFNSSDQPLVQVADFISGVIWAASEGEEVYLLRSLQRYFPLGSRTNTLLHFE